MTNQIKITETYRASRIVYTPRNNGTIESRIDGEQTALIVGDSLQVVRKMTYARIVREAAV